MEVHQADRDRVPKTDQSDVSETKIETAEEAILHPSPDDVLMGRGAPSTDFTGNLRFRELVKERRGDYVNAKRRKDKQGVAGEIIATVKKRGGRFLQRIETCRKVGQDGGTKKVTIWKSVNDRKTLLVKVKQLMRDVGPEAQQKRNMRREMRRQMELGSIADDSEDEDTAQSSSKIMFKGTGAATGSPTKFPVYHGRPDNSLHSLPFQGHPPQSHRPMLDHTSPMMQLMPPLQFQHTETADDASFRQRLQQEMTSKQLISFRQDLQLRQELQFRTLSVVQHLSDSQRNDGVRRFIDFSMPFTNSSAAAFAAQKEQFLCKHFQDQQYRVVREVFPMRSQQQLSESHIPPEGGNIVLGLSLPQSGQNQLLYGLASPQSAGPRPGSLLTAALRQQYDRGTRNWLPQSSHQGF